MKKSLDDPKNHRGALELNTIFKMTRAVFKQVNGCCMEGGGDFAHVKGCCMEGGDFAQLMRMQWERFQLTGRKNKGLCQDLLSSLDDFKHSLEKHSVGMLWREFKPCVCGWLYHSRTVAPNWGRFYSSGVSAMPRHFWWFSLVAAVPGI